jgi:hypothetical protein
VDLRGFDSSGMPTTSADAIRGFLDGLGVPTGRIPSDMAGQAGLYRTLLADRPMLIVLDNARDEQQVRPLLPAGEGCLVIVTSRNQLVGLAATSAAQLLTVDLLSAGEARALLAARLGSERADGEPGPVSELAQLCARLPLALTIAAARAAARPAQPLTALAEELCNANGRLDGLDLGEPAASLRGVFSWSYRQLAPSAAKMFRLLGVHPAPDITAIAAARLAATSLPDARAALAELTRIHLITELSPGRYSLHDLLRAYAAEQAHLEEGANKLHATVDGLLDCYLPSAGGSKQQPAGRSASS